jgi:EAL domain-containing protein (putative c-di-GMP-specific phosphodiesterase class I)
MICIITKNMQLASEVTKLLEEQKLSVRCFAADASEGILGLYDAGVMAAVVDESIGALPQHAWFDLLNSLARRVPVLVLNSKDSKDGFQKGSGHIPSRNYELLNSLQEPTATEIVNLLLSAGLLKDGIASAANSTSDAMIPQYSMQVALHMMRTGGAISMLTINASSFRKVAIDYGTEAYQKLQDCFQQILERMWGAPGCFRKSDRLMRRSLHSNTFYVFLEQSRQSKTVPAPGVLEKMADRVAVRIQEELWSELFKPAKERKLPDCIHTIPEVCVGHATALYNPTVDSVEVIDHLIEGALEVSKVQVKRVKDRTREIMQTLVQTRDLLYPNYQAVFNLQTLTKDMLDRSRSAKSIAPMVPSLYGFESLIRVRAPIVEQSIAGDHLVHMQAKFLRPDIMFALAAQAKVSLELDQVCLSLGINNAVQLPGRLMVNVLPRNLLHLERLLHLLAPRGQIVFELSESEGISNPKQMARMREFVSRMGLEIAADDFGKGYASIERVIKLKPEMIKLDRSLVDGIHKDDVKKAFVEGMIKGAKMVNALILAEGVELWEEAEVVRDLGCDLIQGFLCHRPESLETLLPQLGLVPQSESEEQPLNQVA